MLKKYSIDVIVPAFNAKNTIEKCLNSLLNQKYENLRVIIIDDGSTDNTNSIASEICKKSNGKVLLVTQQNAGVSVARNKGLEISNADFIGFVDADDYVSEDMYLEMIKVVDDETDLVMCGRYDVLGNEKMKRILPNKVHNDTNISNNKKLLSTTSLFVWDKIFRKSVIDNYKIDFPLGLKYAEDAVFLAKFYLHSKKIRVICEAFYYYIISREGSATYNCSPLWLDIPKSLDMINQYYLKQGVFFNYWKELESLSFGYFRRRINSLYFHKNKLMQFKYIKAHIEFMNNYFPKWKKSTKGLKGLVYNNSFVRSIYVLLPNSIKKISKKSFEYLRKLKSKRVLYKYFYNYAPVNKNISLYISYSGDSISDNPLYIAKNSKKYEKIYFASRNIIKDKIFCKFNNLDFEIVDVRSIKYIWLLATSSFIVTNSRVPTYFSKRTKQTLVNTWHGTPIKTLGASMMSGIKDIGRNQNQFLMSDFLIFPNEFTKNVMYSDFVLNNLYRGRDILQAYPRNEPFSYSFQKRLDLRNKLGVNNKKLIIYMPTWRGQSIDTVNQNKYLEDLTNMLYEIDSKLDSNSLMYVKLHQTVNRFIDDYNFKNIKKAPDTYDIYEILNASDVLISDYSSVMFDYLYSKKPIVLFLYDYEEYKQYRGFYFDVKETPFYKAYDTETLINYLNSDLIYSYDEYYSKFCLSFEKSFSKDFWDSISDDNLVNLKNEDKKYDIYFFDSVSNKSIANEIIQLSKKDNVLIVWYHLDIDENTEKFIFENKKILNFVIVPNEMPITIEEKLILMFYSKFNIMKRFAKKIYKKELKRFFGDIKISNIENRSKRTKFLIISKCINNK